MRGQRGTHARVESARQALVKEEESYLQANGWQKANVAGEWLWRKSEATPAGATVTMYRSDAVWFQYSKLSEGKNDTGR